MSHSAECSKRIFTRGGHSGKQDFYSNNAKAARPPGRGSLAAGSYFCKVLVNLSGGQIRVESQQGEWCRFVFTLPTCSPNPGGMKRLPDAAGQPGAVEDPASMKPVE